MCIRCNYRINIEALSGDCFKIFGEDWVSPKRFLSSLVDIYGVKSEHTNSGGELTLCIKSGEDKSHVNAYLLSDGKLAFVRKHKGYISNENADKYAK